MYPYLIRLDHPHIWVASYPTLIGLAVVVCLLVAPPWAQSLEGVDRRTMRRILAILAIATFLGGHLHYLLNSWRYVVFRMNAGVYDTLLWTGIHAGGAVLALVLATMFVALRYRISPGKLGDAMVPAVGLGIAIARIGCFLQGCCYGTPCSWPWCVAFPQPSNVWDRHRVSGLVPPDATHSAPVHPLQLYFAAVGLLILLTALWLHPRKRYDGQVTLVALLIFSATSAALEGFRQDFGLRVYWGTLPQLTWVAMAMTATALLVLVIAELAHRRGRSYTRSFLRLSRGCGGAGNV